MSDQKKPTDSSSTDSAATDDDAGKELDAEQLENVAGGLLPAVNQGAYKVAIKWSPVPDDGIKIIGPVDGVALKK